MCVELIEVSNVLERSSRRRNVKDVGTPTTTLSWGGISVVGASGATWNFYTYDGVYQAFLTPGQYKFSISQPGYAPQTWSYSVSPGQSGTGANVYLEQSNIPVPEFSTIALVAFSALAASLYLLKRRRK